MAELMRGLGEFRGRRTVRAAEFAAFGLGGRRMLGHIEDKRRKLPSLEKSLLNALCAAFNLEICARSCSCAPVDIREGLLGIVCNRAKSEGPFMAQSGHRRRR